MLNESFVDEHGRKWKIVKLYAITDRYDIERRRWPWSKPEVRRVPGDYIAWCRSLRAGT